MVTKHLAIRDGDIDGYILAKNHMVTKRITNYSIAPVCYILAKNHMVTKQSDSASENRRGYILAKNHMVTKQSFSLWFR